MEAPEVAKRLADEVVDSREPNLDVRKFLDAEIELFGGPTGLAKELYKDFKKLPLGNAGRIRIYGLLVSLLEKLTIDEGDDTEDEAALRSMVQEQFQEAIQADRARMEAESAG